VEDHQDRGHELILEVEAQSASASCPRCGQVSHQLHQNHGHRVRDLRISQSPVFLNLNRRPFKCRPCEKPLSEAFEFGVHPSYAVSINTQEFP
jgi:transposase